MDLFTSVRKARSLDRLAELEVEDAVLFAQRQQALCDVEDLCRAQPDGDHAVEFLPLEVALTCGVAHSTATHRLAAARHLVSDLPRTHALLLAGRLRVGQGLAIMEETRDLARQTCAALEAAVLGKLDGLSTGDTRRLVKKTLVRLDATASEQRRQAQHRRRRAFVSPKPDGRAFLGVHGSAEAALGSWEHLTALAKLTFGSDDPRTLDQQRADLALALPGFALAGRHGHGPSLRAYLGLPTEQHEQDCTLRGDRGLTPAQQRRLQAVIVVPVETALGLSDEPAELTGYGPVGADHARDLLAAAELRQACADLTTGRLLALADQRLTPPAWAGWYWPTAHHRQADDQLLEAAFAGHGPSTGPTRRARRQQQRQAQAAARRQRETAPASARQPGDRPPPITLQDALLSLTSRTLQREDRHEPRHDPSPGLVDFVVLRDTRCVGPGCSLPSRHCDLDHTVPWPAGATSAANLGPASRRCHNAKTYGGWTLTPHPDGSITWTSPTGTSHTRPPRTTGADLSALHAPGKHVPPHQRPA